MHRPPKPLTPTQTKFAAAIADGSTIKEACDSVGISQNTGTAWNNNPQIIAAIAQGEKAAAEARYTVTREFHSERTRVILPALREKLDAAVPLAIDTFIKIMEKGKRDSDRINAAKEVIRLAGISEYERISHAQEHSEAVKHQGLTVEAADEIRRKILGIDAARTIEEDDE